MIKKVHVKKGDSVTVLSGKDKGKKGKVLTVFPSEGKVIVEGVNMATKHKKARKAGDPSGIIHQEAAIYADKVMVNCNKCGKASRTGIKMLADGQKARYCKKCGEIIE